MCAFGLVVLRAGLGLNVFEDFNNNTNKNNKYNSTATVSVKVNAGLGLLVVGSRLMVQIEGDDLVDR